jgi:HEAT repeat protein
MPGILALVSVLLDLTQAGTRIYEQVTQVTALLEKAHAEGRDITDAELDEVRKAAVEALSKLG